MFVAVAGVGAEAGRSDDVPLFAQQCYRTPGGLPRHTKFLPDLRFGQDEPVGPQHAGRLRNPQTSECPGPRGYRGTLTADQNSGLKTDGLSPPFPHNCGYAYGDQRCHRSMR